MSGHAQPPGAPAPSSILTKHSVDPTDTQEITSFKHLTLRQLWEMSREPSDQRRYMELWQLILTLCSMAYGMGLDPDDKDLKEVETIQDTLAQLRSPYPYPPTMVPYEDGQTYLIKHELVLDVSRVLAHQVIPMREQISKELREYAFHQKIGEMMNLMGQILRLFSRRGWLRFDEVISTKATARERGTAFAPLPPLSPDSGGEFKRASMPAAEMGGGGSEAT